jgi:hypothetical protein
MGTEGPRVRLSPFVPKLKLAPKPAKGAEDIWVHPCAPMSLNSLGLGPIRLDAERPAWIGLAQLLRPMSKGKGGKARAQHPRAGAALVVQQWARLSGQRRTRLLILDFVRDKAMVRGRFFEHFPIQDLGDPALLERVQARLNDAQQVERDLLWALKRAAANVSWASARTAFWTATEPAFLEWLEGGCPEPVPAAEGGEAAPRPVDPMRALARRVFDQQAQVLESCPRRLEAVAEARRWLTSALWPKAATAETPT